MQKGRYCIPLCIPWNVLHLMVFPLFSLYTDVYAILWVCGSQSSSIHCLPTKYRPGFLGGFAAAVLMQMFYQRHTVSFLVWWTVCPSHLSFSSCLFAASEDFRAGESSWPPAPHLSAMNRSVGRWNVTGGVEHIQPKGRCCKELKKPVFLNILEPSSLGKLFLPQALISLGITFQGSLGIYPSLFQIFSIVVLNCLFPPKQTNPLKMAYLIS